MRRLLLVTAAVGVLVAGCGSDGGEAGELLPTHEREPAPEVVAETVAGDELALADLDGPVLVNFWGSWCGPCAQEAPELANLYRHYRERGVEFVGVNVRDDRHAAQRFAEEVGKPYPSWFDPPGEIAASFGGVGPAAMPSTLLLDADHRVAARFFGAVTYAQVQQRLEPLLAERDGEVDDAAEEVDDESGLSHEGEVAR